MSINDIGKEGERLARTILIDRFKVDGIFQADWIVEKNGNYYVVEVKHKEMFKAPPFDGHGLDVRQVKSRMKFFHKFNIRCLFLVIDMTGKVFWQWLDVLEKSASSTQKTVYAFTPLKGLTRQDESAHKKTLGVYTAQGVLIDWFNQCLMTAFRSSSSYIFRLIFSYISGVW